jgi:glycosyltransferase involved in cell wall biosynthesis
VLEIPSRQENHPNTGLESHACGNQVVAFATGGVVDILDHHITGALAEPFDPLSVAGAIRWVLVDPQRCREAANQAALRSGAGGRL